MQWEPTTRGTKLSKYVCHYGECQKFNYDLNHYVVDRYGIRYFCDDHWKWIIFLFQLIKECDFCKRNYNAELYKKDRTLDSLKHEYKWWEPCSRHGLIFNDKMCMFTGLDFD